MTPTQSSFARVAIQNAITSAESIGGRLTFDAEIAKHIFESVRPEDLPFFRAIPVGDLVLIRHATPTPTPTPNQ